MIMFTCRTLTYVLKLHTSLYPPQQIPGYAPVAALVVTISLELCTSYSSSCYYQIYRPFSDKFLSNLLEMAAKQWFLSLLLGA